MGVELAGIPDAERRVGGDLLGTADGAIELLAGRRHDLHQSHAIGFRGAG
jgi:hypothetical protein